MKIKTYYEVNCDKLTFDPFFAEECSMNNGLYYYLVY